MSLSNHEMPTKFVVLPKATDNATLLGIDFLEDMDIMIDAPRRAWRFYDSNETYPFKHALAKQHVHAIEWKTEAKEFAAKTNKPVVGTATTDLMDTLAELFDEDFGAMDGGPELSRKPEVTT